MTSQSNQPDVYNNRQYNRSVSNKLEKPVLAKNSNNIYHSGRYNQEVQKIIKPAHCQKVIFDDKIYEEPRNLQHNIFGDIQPFERICSNMTQFEQEIEIKNSKTYQDLLDLYNSLQTIFSQKNEEVADLKKENVELIKKVEELKYEISKITENRYKERQLYEKKIKETDLKYRIVLEKNRRIFNSNEDSNKKKSSNLPHPKQNARLKLNSELFDIKDSNELNSLMVAIKLQSETLPEIDGVPLKTYLKNIAENNKNLEIFQDEEEDLKENNNEEERIDPDKMTYEQLLELTDKIGKVSKGLKENQIQKVLKANIYSKEKFKAKQENCSICLKEFFNSETVFELQNCNHIYHYDCIKEWLTNEKFCPICKKDVE